MPGVAQSFQEHVTSFYGKFTSMAYGTKEGIIIYMGASLGEEKTQFKHDVVLEWYYLDSSNKIRIK